MGTEVSLDREFGPAGGLSVIGRRYHDPAGINIVTGKHDFAEDHITEGTLYARILGSRYAHANVISIDTSKAEGLEGVKAVITYQDNPLWSGKVLMVDQPLAAVAAVDEATAERALDLINVDYEVLPAVFDPEEAMKLNAPLVGFRADTNMVEPAGGVVRGDIEKGFAEADVIIDETVGWVSRHTHNELEPDSAVGWWEEDVFHCWSSSQGSFGRRGPTAAALKIPLHKVRIYTHGTGGGFGGKGQSNPETVCALLSKKTGKPVALKLPRRLYTVYRVHQHGPKLRAKIGAKSDGTLTAVELTGWNDGGYTANITPGKISSVAELTWKCPNYKFKHFAIATNKGSGGAWRGVMNNVSQFLTDIALEKLAAKLNINPLELRRKVFIPTWDTPHQDTGQPMPNFGVRECLEKVAEAIDYSAKYHAPGTKTLPDGRLHGIGITAQCYGAGGALSACGITINMNADATVNFNVGTSRLMGSYPAMAIIIAETIGITYDDVRCGDWGNTGTAPDGGGQGASQLMASSSFACKMAAEEVRSQLFAVAATQLKVKPEDLDAKNGEIFVKVDPTKKVTHLATRALIRAPVIGKGAHGGSAEVNKLRRPVGKFPVGTSIYPINTGPWCGVATAAEVAVDPDTGEVELLNFANAVDAGRVIERTSCEGQIAAGMPLEFASAILFDDISDPLTGRLLSVNHLNDPTATTKDLPGPEKNQRYLLETIGAVAPYGLHGIGEPAATTCYASINNAINNAIGKWIVEVPATPRTILQALGKA